MTLVGFDVLLATKLMMIFGVLIAGITMYLLGKHYGESWGIISHYFMFILHTTRLMLM